MNKLFSAGLAAPDRPRIVKKFIKYRFFTMLKSGLLVLTCLTCSALNATVRSLLPEQGTREHLPFDLDWRFALGHAYDTNKDFNHGTGSFSYLAKTGYGDGAASPSFDDRAWRIVDLPHDWAREQPFDKRASASHGFKAIGRNFPGASIGWYRKKFIIPASDLGRHISIAFDGVTRNSAVWVNGHYLGTEPGGFLGFEYNISEYLNYGGENTIALRADVTIEEGWFYEGAGIYRHVWLNKSDPLHIAPDGTFVTVNMNAYHAQVSALTTLINEDKTGRTFVVHQTIIDSAGKTQQTAVHALQSVKPFSTVQIKSLLTVDKPVRWSLERPYLYKLITSIEENNKIIDSYVTSFGIRSIRFSADSGFFLNEQHVEIKGTNNHQDHAGVGSALPDALQEFRIRKLKEMGCNAYRCSHNPPTPELLTACDRLGMLVIDENRQMGVSAVQLDNLKRLMLRDRNHPSVISWSVGNEEWAIESNIQGARIAATMQAYAKQIDSTRYITAAISGGIGSGISTVIDLLGYNYVATKNTDEQHKNQPRQFSWGTEEGSTVTSRGAYFDNISRHELAAYDQKQNNFFLSLENGWKFYAARPYLAGMFIWTGFDYRGEPTPFGWPSVESYFGMLDACGFPKDDYYYLQAWWKDKPVLHLLPHWNWKGHEGKLINVWAYSNCEQVELFLNGKTLGRKLMPRNGHLEWSVSYHPGNLVAIGSSQGKLIINDTISTSSGATDIALSADRLEILADHKDLSMVTVQVIDKNKLHVPDAANEIQFELSGPARIIGLGNGDQTSLEPDAFIEHIQTVSFGHLQEKYISAAQNLSASFFTADYGEVMSKTVDTKWQTAFKEVRDEVFEKAVKAVVYKGEFVLPEDIGSATATLFYKSMGKKQSIYINGKQLVLNIPADKIGNNFLLSPRLLHRGKNTILITTSPLIRENIWAGVNTDAGLIQLRYAAAPSKRQLYNGYAQVILQSTGESGTVILTAKGRGLKSAQIKVTTLKQ